MTRVRFFKTSWFFWLVLSILYFVTHLTGLTQLPVFADEAIYIRWSQLLLSDWQRYLLFPLNDGKTPLFIWMSAPFIAAVANPLYAARLLSVVGGFIQLVLIVAILKQLRVSRVGQLVGALIVVFAPFWFFHHRMALMDGWLTVWISLTTLAVLHVVQLATAQRKNSATAISSRFLWPIVVSSGVFAGLMTKIPFILSFPSYFLLIFIQKQPKAAYWKAARSIVAVLGIGVGLFLLLLLTPEFPQLVARGGDFLMSPIEVLRGRYQETIPSIPTYLGYFLSYAGWGLFVLALMALLLPGKRRAAWIFLVGFVLFSAPIWILGKVVYPRYLFPAMLYLTLLASLGTDTLWQWSNQSFHTANRRAAIRLLVVLLLVQLLMTSLTFLLPSWMRANETPFVSADRAQYLTQWSSGHGLTETLAFVNVLANQKTNGRILVATEGNFGSLPDGLLLYNFRHPIDQAWIEGIGYPVNWITPEFARQITPEDQVLLVVNSDRLLWTLDSQLLLQEYCRPYAGSCLQVWDITAVYQNFIKS